MRLNCVSIEGPVLGTLYSLVTVFWALRGGSMFWIGRGHLSFPGICIFAPSVRPLALLALPTLISNLIKVKLSAVGSAAA
jgi:hypothetical protein